MDTAEFATEDSPESIPENDADPRDVLAPFLFSVSNSKLIVMSVCTFSLYQLVWHYKNWRLLRTRQHGVLGAAVRAWLSPFSSFILFGEIARLSRNRGIDSGFAPTGLAFAYMLFYLPLTLNSLLGVGPEWFWIVNLFSFFPLIFVQAEAHDLNSRETPNARLENPWTAWNVLGAALASSASVLCWPGRFLVRDGPPNEALQMTANERVSIVVW